jgi:hypothetical protein
VNVLNHLRKYDISVCIDGNIGPGNVSGIIPALTASKLSQLSKQAKRLLASLHLPVSGHISRKSPRKTSYGVLILGILNKIRGQAEALLYLVF